MEAEQSRQSRQTAVPRSHKKEKREDSVIWQDRPWVTIAVRDAVPRLLSIADERTSGIRRLS